MNHSQGGHSAVGISERVPLSTKLAYGAGAIAYGIKDNGFSVFLLLFYNQVVGLPASQVGFAILFALVIDAFVDPVIGTLSDRTRTRWGRRHPWLYASALPIALTWLMLWNPPAGSHRTVLGYLILAAVLTRAAISTNEVPSYAMAPELTRDYDERTIVLRYRYVFGWAAGLIMLVLAYSVFLAGRQTGPAASPGYHDYAIAGAIIMAASVLVSAVGTHRRTAHPPAQPIASATLRQTIGQMRQALSNRAFLTLILAGVFAYSNQGMSFAMSNYLLGYVWHFGAREFSIYSAVLFAGVMLAFFGVAPLAAVLGKKHAAALLSVLSSTTAVAPYLLRLAGLFPPLGSVWMLPAFLVCLGLATGLGIGIMILGGSMMSDVVEASEEHTGRREEGLFFAGALFMMKCTSGIGIALSGMILGLSGFPERAVVGQVSPAVLDRMTLIFSCLTLGLAATSALVFLRFPFGRTEHQARLAKLAVAAREKD